MISDGDRTWHTLIKTTDHSDTAPDNVFVAITAECGVVSGNGVTCSMLPSQGSVQERLAPIITISIKQNQTSADTFTAPAYQHLGVDHESVMLEMI